MCNAKRVANGFWGGDYRVQEVDQDIKQKSSGFGEDSGVSLGNLDLIGCTKLATVTGCWCAEEGERELCRRAS